MERRREGRGEVDRGEIKISAYVRSQKNWAC